jgi:hypothetical protein
MKRKCLAVGIILLFVGVTIAPTINFNTVKASDDNDLVEVTTQACGLFGFKPQTVKLTRQQYLNIERYMVAFKTRLNQTTTREEAIPIFKEAIVELNVYGLLPKGMSVQRAQRLVTGGFLNKNYLKLQENSNYNSSLDRGLLYNRFCLIAGGATNSFLIGPLFPIDRALLGFGITFVIFALFYSMLPVNLFGKIFFESSFGEIFTFGAFGYNTISGDYLCGNIKNYRFPSIIPPYYDYIYLGVRGFSGLQFYSRASSLRYFFGSCLEINVTSEITDVR